LQAKERSSAVDGRLVCEFVCADDDADDLIAEHRRRWYSSTALASAHGRARRRRTGNGPRANPDGGDGSEFLGSLIAESEIGPASGLLVDAAGGLFTSGVPLVAPPPPISHSGWEGGKSGRSETGRR
jgi:hypothetical protein